MKFAHCFFGNIEMSLKIKLCFFGFNELFSLARPISLGSFILFGKFPQVRLTFFFGLTLPYSCKFTTTKTTATVQSAIKEKRVRECVKRGEKNTETLFPLSFVPFSHACHVIVVVAKKERQKNTISFLQKRSVRRMTLKEKEEQPAHSPNTTHRPPATMHIACVWIA